jgi:ribonuclease J
MSSVRIFALGGLDEDGKNMYVLENDGDIFVFECGLKYPDGDQLGVEMIIPDFTYIKENQDRVKAIFITHGHDDVMAALPLLLQDCPKLPVYMSPLTAAMFTRKAVARGLKDLNIHRIQRSSECTIGKTKIRTFGVTQSIADGFGVAVLTKKGYVVYSSEFIFDYDNMNEAFNFDITALTELGSAGVLALMTESVGSSRPGHAAPNHKITPLIEQYFEDAAGRIFITLFNQNLYRVIEVFELALKYNRKVFIISDELKSNMADMAKLSYYHIPAGLEITPSQFSNDMQKVVVIVAGNGNNLFMKMHAIATKEHELVELRKDDTVIIASPAVPGTERQEAAMEDDLYKETSKIFAVDSRRMFSMHASIEDLKMMIYLLKPKFYIPVKGEYRQLIANADIGMRMNIPLMNIAVADNGQVLTIKDGVREDTFGQVQTGDIMVDGKDNFDASGVILRDRELLSTDGVIIVGVVVNHTTKEVIGGPDVQSRGVIYLKDADYIVKEIGNIMEKTINDAVAESKYDNMTCRIDARDKIQKYVMRETGKRPMILPAIVEIIV